MSAIQRPLVAITAASLIMLAGCGGNGKATAAHSNSPTTPSSAPSAEVNAAEAVPFKITDSAYALVPDMADAGSYYVKWAAVIENPNEAFYGAFPKITVTALDGSGSVLGTDTQVLNALPPGAVEGFA